jgi:hypothetical protein
MAVRVIQSPPTTTQPRSLADMTDEELIRLVGPEPAWLERLRSDAEARGLDKITMEEIDAEIEAYRQEKRAAHGKETR